MNPNSVNVFLSYASEDRKTATRLCGELRALGLTVWFDKDSLLPGQEWKRELLRAIRAADFFLVLLSSRSVSKSGVVQREVREAIEVMQERPEGSVFVIPVRIEPVVTTYEALAKIQWVDLFDDWDFSIKRLVETFRVFGGFSPRHHEVLDFKAVSSEVEFAASHADIEIYSDSTHDAVVSHISVPREPLRALLQDLMHNIRVHGERVSKGTPAATVRYETTRTHLTVEISNPCGPGVRPSLPRASVATAVLAQVGASISFESLSAGTFRAKLQLPLSE